MFELPDISEIVARALAEDLGVGSEPFETGARPDAAVLERDVTSASCIDEDASLSGVVVARQACVVCGLPVAAEVFERLSEAAGLFVPVEFFPLVPEGARVEPGTAIAEVEGSARAVLSAERTALNFLMVLSGIATETSAWVAAAGGSLQVCDTRKTVPGLRTLSKYAVRVGGGTNHRAGLWDQVLVKDNHRLHAGGITAAIGRARLRHPELVVEVEADTIEQAAEAVASGADIVLLDNMDPAQLAEAVAAARSAAGRRGRPVVLEVSGGLTRENLPSLVSAGIDRVSSSRITLAPPVDIALDVT